MLVGERERAERARRVLAGDEVLDVIGDLKGSLVDVVPADGRMRHALRTEELREVEEPAHPAGVRATVDLEQELFSARRGEEIGVVRSPAQPRLDPHSSERAAGDLV